MLNLKLLTLVTVMYVKVILKKSVFQGLRLFFDLKILMHFRKYINVF